MAIEKSATDKRSALQKQIDDLKQQMLALDQEAINELKSKLADARKVVTNLEHELADLTGKPATPQVRQRRERRPSITDDALKDQIIKVMATHGAAGMNAKALAEKLHQDPIRIRKYIKDFPQALKRTGAGPSTKFFLN